MGLQTSNGFLGRKGPVKSLMLGAGTMSRDSHPRKPEEVGKGKWGIFKGNLGYCGLKERNQTVPES